MDGKTKEFIDAALTDKPTSFKDSLLRRPVSLGNIADAFRIGLRSIFKKSKKTTEQVPPQEQTPPQEQQPPQVK